jgi:hypothetical protein
MLCLRNSGELRRIKHGSLSILLIDKKAVGVKWVYKLKHDPEGKTMKHIRHDWLQRVPYRDKDLITMKYSPL